jgi:hypothetical protein
MSNENIWLKMPKGWRMGQTIFNFLEWLKREKKYANGFTDTGSRMADPFHISDEKFEELYAEFIALYGDKS